MYVCMYVCTARFPRISLTEGILRLGINNFQPEVECGEASSGIVAAEGRWAVPKTFQRRPSFSVACKCSKIPILCFFYTV